ncbi:MAG: IPT/TIG domain-containing protein [Thermoanaerobaculia bacterium]
MKRIVVLSLLLFTTLAAFADSAGARLYRQKAIMKHLLFALLVSAGALAQAPVIHSITPDSGPDTGGTSVVITGDDLHTAVACLLPCPPRVAFGEIEVDAVEVSDHQLNVTTPAHPAGVVDVTVTIPGRDPVVVEDGFTFLEGVESAWERVLLPIDLSGLVHGANGTQWSTDFWMHNSGPVAVSIADRVCPAGETCPAVVPLTLTLEAGHSLHNPDDFFQPDRSNPSQLLYVSREGARDVAMGLRVADVSRHALNGGTDLPVIRDDEFLTRTAQLFNVPLDGQTFRLLLRVYDITYSEASYAVRFYPSGEGVEGPVYGTTLTAKTPGIGPFRPEAAYAELDITHLLQLRLAWPQSARIEIQPLTPGSRYWAVVSLTNNETQLVTLVTPQ